MGKYPNIKAVRRNTTGVVNLAKRRYWFDDDADESNTDDKNTNVIDLSKIDWSKIDPNMIPEDVLKKTKPYEKILNEAVSRRQKIKDLNKQIDQFNEGTQDQPEIKKPEVTDDMPEWAKALVATINNQQTQNLAEWRTQAAEATGIKSDFVRDNLQGKNYGEVLAQATKIATDLGISPPKPKNPITAANPSGDQRTSLAKQAMERLTNGNGAQVFSPELQKGIGGGVIEN